MEKLGQVLPTSQNEDSSSASLYCPRRGTDGDGLEILQVGTMPSHTTHVKRGPCWVVHAYMDKSVHAKRQRLGSKMTLACSVEGLGRAALTQGGSLPGSVFLLLLGGIAGVQ